MSDSPQLRAHTDADLLSIGEIYYEAIHTLATEHYDAAQREAWAPRDVIDAERWRARLDGLEVLVADLDGRVVGFVAWKAGDGYVDLLYVHPDVARQGIGTQMVHAVEEVASRNGLARLWVRASDVSRPVFAKCGFVALRSNDAEVRGQTLRNTYMEKRVPSPPWPGREREE